MEGMASTKSPQELEQELREKQESLDWYQTMWPELRRKILELEAQLAAKTAELELATAKREIEASKRAKNERKKKLVEALEVAEESERKPVAPRQKPLAR